MHFDIAIVGGGPAGSTTGSLLKKYEPSLKVAIFERETFPRDHVGESQLPGTSAVLAEMGVWDKVEAANFPIKIGATYRWGKSRELWDFQFLAKEEFIDEQRPAKYSGQRTQTAFQVDRAIYDDILLKHARELGCEVFEGTGVTAVQTNDGRIENLTLSNGESITAETYVDASGHVGILRRALGVETDCPTSLQNVAFWDYWQNADWATEIGIGGTFVQVMSLGYGWIWFIPIGPTRTSVGLILPAQTYKNSGKRPQDLYLQALSEDERIKGLMKNAVREEKFSTTKDWSFLASQHAGENWFLVGESGGFADPILAAGLTITHVAAREAANTILEIKKGRWKTDWLLEQYDSRQKRRISNHIRFADFWYTSNGQFTDLQAFTAQIAKDTGLEMNPQDSWRWLAQGGFIDEDLTMGTGGYTLEAIRTLPEFLSNFESNDVFAGKNILKLRVDDADVEVRAFHSAGTIERIECYRREDKLLPVRWVIGPLISILRAERTLPGVLEKLEDMTKNLQVEDERKHLFMTSALRGLEAMVLDGWVQTDFDPSVPLVEFRSHYKGLTWSDGTTIGQASGA